MGIVEWNILGLAIACVWFVIFVFAYRLMKKQNNKYRQKEIKQELSIDQIWEQFRKTNRDHYRNLLMNHYRYLVKDFAKRLHRKLANKIELDDLISAGIFGLLDAIYAFDPMRGVKFETYCTTRIRSSILDKLRSMNWVPRLARAQASQLSKTQRSFKAHLGRKPNPLIEAQKRDLKSLLTKGLTRAERLIIVLYYYDEMTMKEIGATLDLSESRVSQIHSSIIARLKAQMTTRKKDFSVEAEKKKQRPREQHYLFAHEAIRDLFFKDPKGVINKLTDNNWKECLLEIWDKAGKNFEKCCFVAPDELSREIRIREDNTVIVLITLPKPQVISEAYFIALICRPSKKYFTSEQKVIPRCLLLEYSVPRGYGSLNTALHEWTEEGVQKNIGYGCEPTLEAFYEAVCNILDEPTRNS